MGCGAYLESAPCTRPNSSNTGHIGQGFALSARVQLGREGPAGGFGVDPEEFRRGGPEVGERGALPHIDARRHLRAGVEHEDLFARVVGGRRRRIVAVVGRENQNVLRAQCIEEFRKPAVEGLEGARISGGVVAVSERLVEVDQVGEDQAPVAWLSARRSTP